MVHDVWLLTVGFSQQHLKAMMACLGIRSPLSCGMSSTLSGHSRSSSSLVLTTLPDEPHSDSWQLRAGSAWRSICSVNIAGMTVSSPLGMSEKKHGKPSHLFFVLRKCDPHAGMKTKMLGNQKGGLLEILPTTLDHHQR